MLQSQYQDNLIEAGCDEAGRGCYAGPVFAAAVILPKGFHHPKLNDSKQVKENDRNELRIFIEKEAIAYAVASCDVTEIDELNILNASIKAMHKAIEQLNLTVEFLSIDGNRFKPFKNIQHTCIIKGDGLYANIAAASILAKTHRDEYMRALHKQHPEYAWHKNKGYGTAEHRKAIDEYGLCAHHRKSFNILPRQLSIF
ncbi:MAG: ribonuclease HII [Arachidicoccus sp.]|nr:ribonuclease HII [Arachidicoccus sp.]